MGVEVMGCRFIVGDDNNSNRAYILGVAVSIIFSLGGNIC